MEPVIIRVPKDNVNDETVRLVQWHVEPLSAVREGDLLADLETSKTSIQITAPCAGILQYKHRAGAEVPIGAVLCVISADGLAQPAEWSEPLVDTAQRGLINDAVPRFSQEALALMKSRGLKAELFRGQRLVRADDIKAYLGEPSGPTPDVVADSASTQPFGPVGVSCHPVELSRSKLLEIKYLRAAHSRLLPSMVTRDCQAPCARADYLDQHTFLAAVLIREAAQVLQNYPSLNGFFDQGKAFGFEEVNIGYALDAGRGLKVPVLRQAARKTHLELEQELQDLLVAYLEDKLPVDVLAGGTFTITDLSGEGVDSFVPLIYDRQAAMLGIGAPRGDAAGGAGMVLPLILAFDHQMSNGREAARFLAELCQRVENCAELKNDDGTGALACQRCGRTKKELAEIGGALLMEVLEARSTSLICSLCLKGY